MPLIPTLVFLAAIAQDSGDFIGPPAPPELVERDPRALRGELNDEERVQLAFGTGFGERFSPHKLNYAAAGANDLKMELSFKYRLVSEMPAFLAFTNIIAWDIYDESYPFRDINFNPELFYRFDVRAEGGLHLDLGYWHNSNGKDENASRSWDRLAARGIVPGTFLGREFVATPTLYYTLSTDQQNSDIEDFLGVWDVGFFWHNMISPKEEGNDLDLILKVIGGRGTFQLSAQYRLESYRFNPYLFTQLFSGYGDTLLEYDERKTELRIGLSFYE